MLEILTFAHDDYLKICHFLFFCSSSLRLMLISMYDLMKLIVYKTHNMTLENTLPLTFSHKTSRAAHELLEKILTV
jgi:hypothetical protein